MSALDVREGYRRWAPTYAAETAISYLDTALVAELTPPLAGKALLDAGCGTGRRLPMAGAALAVGVDLSPEMLQAGVGLGVDRPDLRTLVGDVRDLPLPDQAFDVVWCRLVLGHLPECETAYGELARVAAAGATVIVTDFHPVAAAAGHRRTFRDATGVHELEHHVHSVERHLEAARRAGLSLAALREARIGDAARPFYAQAGKLALYRQHLDLPVVLAAAFRREG
ncbi:class I SAM-dependent methyltransferase [Caulobacter sp. BK020]|uniref:class I SAM-dependent methyltransferase n=1 Tax=Caulobacter sp. BK020 TaxID=2512117 RepID=UPI001043C955|nr:class I SAM-dependent methyltransferase [Caulobacter sp. BK020]TCS14898.1 malonyl-CoA O-methyltransferase [Caulobacter sp. BK020]